MWQEILSIINGIPTIVWGVIVGSGLSLAAKEKLDDRRDRKRAEEKRRQDQLREAETLRKELRDRQMNVFRALMANRRMPMNPERIQALNLLDIEFRDEPSIMNAWTTYLINLNVNGRNPGCTVEACQAAEEQRPVLWENLLRAIAKVMDYDITEEMNLADGGYYPQGHQDLQDLQIQALKRQASNEPIKVELVTPATVYTPPGVLDRAPAGALEILAPSLISGDSPRPFITRRFHGT